MMSFQTSLKGWNKLFLSILIQIRGYCQRCKTFYIEYVIFQNTVKNYGHTFNQIIVTGHRGVGKIFFIKKINSTTSGEYFNCIFRHITNIWNSKRQPH